MEEQSVMTLQSGEAHFQKNRGALFSFQRQFKFNILSKSSSSIYGTLSSLSLNSSARSVHLLQIQFAFKFIQYKFTQFKFIQFKFTQFKFNIRDTQFNQFKFKVLFSTFSSNSVRF